MKHHSKQQYSTMAHKFVTGTKIYIYIYISIINEWTEERKKNDITKLFKLLRKQANYSMWPSHWQKYLSWHFFFPSRCLWWRMVLSYLKYLSFCHSAMQLVSVKQTLAHHFTCGTWWLRLSTHNTNVNGCSQNRLRWRSSNKQVCKLIKQIESRHTGT